MNARIGDMSRHNVFVLGGLIVLVTALACSDTEVPTTEAQEQQEAEAAGYDSTLAAQVGADQYGMKTYVMAFLKRGPNRNQDSLEAAQLQRAHLDNIQRLAAEKKLVIAGPFLDDGDIRGIYVFDVGTVEEAEALTATDPAIQAGRLVMELHPWYGSAALPLLHDLYDKVQKTKI